jgi:predicted DNA-binding transcriptional regulator AlpA
MANESKSSLPMAPLPLLLRERDLSSLLGLSRAMIRKLMAAGKFPACIRIGRCCCWKRTEIEAWIDGGCGAVETGGVR